MTMLRLIGILLIVLAATACESPTAPTAATTQIPLATGIDEPNPVTTTTQATADTTGSTPEDRSCFGTSPQLTEDGFLGRSDAGDSDAQTLAGLNWSDSGDCAAVTLAFRTEPGAPAVDPPSYRAEYLRHTGIVRIELGPEIVDSALSDQIFDTALLDAAYVAFDPAAQALIIDIHLADGVVARVRSVTAPARLVIELEDDDRAAGSSPVFGEAVVVLQPATTTPPMVIEGYGRAGLEVSANVVTSGRGLERTLAFPDSPTRWTFFEWTIRDFQPGPIAIRIGDAPPIEFISQ